MQDKWKPILGVTGNVTRLKFIFYWGSSIMNEIERVAVQGSGLVNILAYGHLIFHGRWRLVRWWTLVCCCPVLMKKFTQPTYQCVLSIFFLRCKENGRGRKTVCVLCMCVCVYLCKRESSRMRRRATRLTEAIRSIISPTVEGLMHTIVSV